MLLNTSANRVIKLLVLLGSPCLLAACPPNRSISNETPEVCKRVFRTDKINWDLPNTLSINDLVTVEKCGFAHHPGICFYSEIIDNEEYPIPSLLAELRRADDDHWRAHVIYLIKAVIERERFHSQVMRDRDLITRGVDLSSNEISKESSVYERVHDLCDGIEIYFLKQDGMKFGEAF